MDDKQGITDIITRLQGTRFALAGAIRAALSAGLTATQIGDLTELKAREVSVLIKAWDLI